MDEKELAFQLKKNERELLEILVAEQLNNLAHEAATNVVESLSSKAYVMPDTRKWARKILAVVSEHSV
jgi:hypothetical protein